MTETIDQQIEAIQVKSINLQQIAEEFIVALDWELKTGAPFTGQPIEAGKIRHPDMKTPKIGDVINVRKPARFQGVQ